MLRILVDDMGSGAQYRVLHLQVLVAADMEGNRSYSVWDMERQRVMPLVGTSYPEKDAMKLVRQALNVHEAWRAGDANQSQG